MKRIAVVTLQKGADKTTAQYAMAFTVPFQGFAHYDIQLNVIKYLW